MLNVLADCSREEMARVVEQAFAPDAVIHLCLPLGDATGGTGLVEVGLGPIWDAFPDVERRVDISITGMEIGRAHV